MQRSSEILECFIVLGVAKDCIFLSQYDLHHGTFLLVTPTDTSSYKSTDWFSVKALPFCGMLYLSFQGHSFKFELPILLSIYIMGQCWWEVRLERSAANILYCWYCYIVNPIDLPSLLFPVQWCWWQARLLKVMQTKSLPKLTAGLCPPHFSKWCVIFSICWYVCQRNPQKCPLMEQGYWLPFIDKCCIINVSTLPIVALFVQICSVCLYLIQSSIFLLLLLLLLLLLNVNTWKKQKLWKSESQMGFELMTLGDLLSQRVVGSNPIKDSDFSKFVFLHVVPLIRYCYCCCFVALSQQQQILYLSRAK